MPTTFDGNNICMHCQLRCWSSRCWCVLELKCAGAYRNPQTHHTWRLTMCSCSKLINIRWMPSVCWWTSIHTLMRQCEASQSQRTGRGEGDRERENEEKKRAMAKNNWLCWTMRDSNGVYNNNNDDNTWGICYFALDGTRCDFVCELWWKERRLLMTGCCHNHRHTSIYINPFMSHEFVLSLSRMGLHSAYVSFCFLRVPDAFYRWR